KSAPYSRWTGPVAVICAWEFTTTFGGQRPNGPAGDGGDGYWVPGSANTYSRPLTLAGKLSSALPMYSLPFTTVGDELTRTFFVWPRQIWEHEGCPHGPAFQARTSEVFRPAYTTPSATVGDETTAAWVPEPKSKNAGEHVAWPHPLAANTPTPFSR